MSSTSCAPKDEIHNEDSETLVSGTIGCHQSSAKQFPPKLSICAYHRQMSGGSEISFSTLSEAHRSISTGSQVFDFCDFAPFTAYPTLFPYAAEAGGDDMIFGGSLMNSETHSYMFKSGDTTLMASSDSGANNKRCLFFSGPSAFTAMYEEILQNPLAYGTPNSATNNTGDVFALPPSHSNTAMCKGILQKPLADSTPNSATINTGANLAPPLSALSSITPPAASETSVLLDGSKKITEKSGVAHLAKVQPVQGTKATNTLPIKKHHQYKPSYKNLTRKRSLQSLEHAEAE